MRIYAKVMDDEGNVSETRTLEVDGASASDLGDAVLVTLGRGLLYESDWTQVRHAVYVKDGGDYWCVGSFGADGQPDGGELEDELYGISCGVEAE